ncbi:MAG TPA: uL30 family ribosomal protein [Candidatus Nanoarchaeia archaeon]|nr:uL30 family ribosomal protein [Candidatus Nanoarchaeia archaeon]
MSDYIAVIRVRGGTKVNRGIELALTSLSLKYKNNCVILVDTPSVSGLIRKVKDYVTFGPIDAETLKLLAEKRGEVGIGEKLIDAGGKKVKPFFRLSPPRKGFGRKGIKVDFAIGGALGDRKEKINALLQRMI